MMQGTQQGSALLNALDQTGMPEMLGQSVQSLGEGFGIPNMVGQAAPDMLGGDQTFSGFGQPRSWQDTAEDYQNLMSTIQNSPVAGYYRPVVDAIKGGGPTELLRSIAGYAGTGIRLDSAKSMGASFPHDIAKIPARQQMFYTGIGGSGPDVLSGVGDVPPDRDVFHNMRNEGGAAMKEYDMSLGIGGQPDQEKVDRITRIKAGLPVKVSFGPELADVEGMAQDLNSLGIKRINPALRK